MLSLSKDNDITELRNSCKYQYFGEDDSMEKGKTILAQMQEIISRYDFKKVLILHKGDKSVKSFTCMNLLTVMLYSQMTAKMSLRDICDGLRSKMNHWYHISLKALSRNNLSHSLMRRPSEIYEAIFYQLFEKLQAERGITNDRRFRFKNPLRSIDSTTISLCLKMFPWAKFRRAKGGIKLHMMYNNKEQLPEFINMTDARQHDINAGFSMPIQENGIYVMDRGYLCYEFLEKLRQNKAFFVIRTKSNTKYRIIERREKSSSLIKADWIVKVIGTKADQYTENLRVVKYFDRETGRVFDYYTNNFSLSAQTIADIYKARWDIEIFFKFIKQNLKIKTFFGTSENAVMIQVWTAMIALLLVEYMRFRCKSSCSIQQAWRIIKDNVFQRYKIEDILSKWIPPERGLKNDEAVQLSLCF